LFYSLTVLPYGNIIHYDQFILPFPVIIWIISKLFYFLCSLSDGID